jgi:ubiquitin thioesterase CYLD
MRIKCKRFFCRYGYVRADKIIAFRELLGQLFPNMTGMTNEEKDPEEFLNALFKHILRPAPFLRIRYVRLAHFCEKRCCIKSVCSDAMKCVRDEYLCQLVIDDAVELGAAGANDQLLPSVQLLLERYFIDARLEFDIQPHVLLIQLPRTAGSPRRFAHIFPNATLDVTHLVHNSE